MATAAGELEDVGAEGVFAGRIDLDPSVRILGFAVEASPAIADRSASQRAPAEALNSRAARWRTGRGGRREAAKQRAQSAPAWPGRPPSPAARGRPARVSVERVGWAASRFSSAGRVHRRIAAGIGEISRRRPKCPNLGDERLSRPNKRACPPGNLHFEWNGALCRPKICVFVPKSRFSSATSGFPDE